MEQSNTNRLSPSERVQQTYQEILFKNREEHTIHNAYDREYREFMAIEEGNSERLSLCLAEELGGQLGTLAKDPVRNQKNLAIVVITLASRAAIRGGLSPELAFSMSDSYIQNLEELDDCSAIEKMSIDAEFQYTRLVSQIKKGRPLQEKEHPHIAKCKDYIFAHLHESLQVTDVANTLHMNLSYLSKLFKEIEGISMKKFIEQEKISLAKNLLIFSNYSYIEIANYLGYTSQSHLGKQFKQFEGVTLAEYRAKYRRTASS